MTRIVIAQCVQQKHPDGRLAKDLYTSDYFKKQREYAEAVADEWFIQSAEHGLVDPDVFLGPYDTHADELDDPKAWAREIVLELDDRIEPPATIELLGGAAYTDPLTPYLEMLAYEVNEPLRGLGIGERKAELDRLRRQAENDAIA